MDSAAAAASAALQWSLAMQVVCCALHVCCSLLTAAGSWPPPGLQAVCVKRRANIGPQPQKPQDKSPESAPMHGAMAAPISAFFLSSLDAHANKSHSCSPAWQVLDPSASTSYTKHAPAASRGCSLPHSLTNSSNKSCLALTGTVLGIVRWSYTLTKASPPATANCHGRLGLQWMELSSSSDPCRAIDEVCREAARVLGALQC